jgi:hypothetical protein
LEYKSVPIKIFSAPGDHRDDFQSVESQINDWMAAKNPSVINMYCQVTPTTHKRETGGYMLTIVVHFE